MSESNLICEGEALRFVGEPFLFVSKSKFHYLERRMEGAVIEYACAYCGEPNDETLADLSAGWKQVYVEDCTVCCRPNVLSVQVDRSTGAVTVEALVEE
jgi:hypothetical protein